MAPVHTHVWVVGSLSGAPWGFLEGRKDPSQPRDSCRMPGAPFAALAFGSVPVIPQGKAGKTKCLHHSVASAEIPISGSWPESQRMAEGNKWNVGGSPAYPGHQADVPSSMLLGKIYQLRTSPSPSHQEVCGGRGDANFPGELPSCCLIQNSLLCFRIKLLCRAGEGEEPTWRELREAPGRRERFGCAEQQL